MRMAGSIGKRAGDRDPLLLAAGKLRRIVRKPLAEPDLAEAPLRARSNASARPASSSGTATFSSAVMVCIRWKAWKTKPISLPRKRASRSSSRPA